MPELWWRPQQLSAAAAGVVAVALLTAAMATGKYFVREHLWCRPSKTDPKRFNGQSRSAGRVCVPGARGEDQWGDRPWVVWG